MRLYVPILMPNETSFVTCFKWTNITFKHFCFSYISRMNSSVMHYEQINYSSL